MVKSDEGLVVALAFIRHSISVVSIYQFIPVITQNVVIIFHTFQNVSFNLPKYFNHDPPSGHRCIRCTYIIVIVTIIVAEQRLHSHQRTVPVSRDKASSFTRTYHFTDSCGTHSRALAVYMCNYTVI